MRLAISVLAALIVGILGTLAYSNYLGDGQALANLQDDLNKTKADLAAAKHENNQAKTEKATMAVQIQQLSSTRDDLQKQLDEAKAPAADNAQPNPMDAMLKVVMKQQHEQKLQNLIKRLHLTPDQIAKLEAAYDEQDKETEAMTSKMFSGGKIDPSAMAHMKGVDQTLDDILTPDQKTAYQQVKVEQKSNSAETVASMQLNQMSSGLQLSDSQKDQVYTELYQEQMNTQDPNWIKNNVNPSDPSALMDAQAAAKDAAMAKILTPDQMTTYRQQAQAQLAMQKSMIKSFMPAGSSPAAPVGVQTPAAVVQPPAP